MSADKAINGTQLVITRTFNAPRELVFEAWTKAEHLQQWWGPKGLTMSVSKLDFRSGGTFHFCLLSPEGDEMWAKFVLHEIVAPERIVFVNSFSDAEGNITRAPFSPVWPLEILNTVTLTEHEGSTTLTLKGEPINATSEELKAFADMHESMQQGFGGTFDQLAEFLTKA
jgi:uncharacterized protein YndB with AHSA1/START domain